MKTLLLIICAIVAIQCNGQPPSGRHRTQTFVIMDNGKWKAIGKPYLSPDTLTTVHAYKWKRERIVAIQDYKKVNGKWEKYGEPYATPDTLRLVHGFIK